MKLTRKTRLTAALLALVGMLFMQLAVAAYACPDFNMSNGSTSFSQADTTGDAMPDCDQPDPDQPALCHAHCQDQQQSFDKAELPSFSPVLLAGIFITMTPIRHSPSSFGPLTARPTRTTDPPISIRNCCFRI